MKFISSLKLSRMLFEEEIQPIMEQRFAGLPYAAATFGMCSENLGLDDETSMDHEWGPRLGLFLDEADLARCKQDLMAAFQETLPTRFKGVNMMWRKPGVSVHDTREAALYHIYPGTLRGALGFLGGKTLPLQDTDWLSVSEQHLLEFTNGVVYRDDIGDLTRARQQLQYYPDNVLYFLLASEWSAAGGDWFPIGRIGACGDDLGLRIQAAKTAQRLMRIAFMISRRYFTYKKWFGSLFLGLPIAVELEPLLHDLLLERRWQAVEEKICTAAALLLEKQNAAGIAPHFHAGVERAVDGRHYASFDFWGVSSAIAAHIDAPLKHIMDNQVFFMHDRALILWNEEVGKWPLLLQQ